jgi:chromosome segregation ATPase
LAKERSGFLGAISRFFKSGPGEPEKDKQGSQLDGISDAFEIQQKKMIAQYDQLKKAIEELDGILNKKRGQLEELGKQKEQLLQEREDILAQAEQANDANDNQAYEVHSRAFDRLQERIVENEEVQSALGREIHETSLALDKYKQQLQEFKTYIDALPQQKEDTIAHLASIKETIDKDRE